MLDYTLTEWLNLLVRWAHVVAAILWVGQTYFFTWLDGRFTEGEAAAAGKGTAGPPPIWMVHSGGFYVVRKEKLGATVPPDLHWFRWEAAFTWMTGLLLLILVYYMGGLMVDPGSGLSTGVAVGLGLATLAIGWTVYDAIWMSPVARAERVGVAVCFVLLVGVAYGLTHVMTGRAAYLHVGALLGTIMTANVWSRILPGQRQMLAAVAAGRAPDLTLAARAKQRSRHNTFIVIPVVAIMLSTHFPVATYGSAWNWLVLAGLTLVGWAVAARLRRA